MTGNQQIFSVKANIIRTIHSGNYLLVYHLAISKIKLPYFVLSCARKENFLIAYGNAVGVTKLSRSNRALLPIPVNYFCVFQNEKRLPDASCFLGIVRNQQRAIGKPADSVRRRNKRINNLIHKNQF